MGIGRWMRSRKKAQREFLIGQVLIKHRVWYPVHNQGREAPAAAIVAWYDQLRCLPERELIMMIADNRARNQFLGKTWP